jgi:two-component system, OmpR family, alkaline phosphatase synthesis response regulator PhoP
MPKKIVLADDEQFIAVAYSDGLTRAGYQIVVAHDGQEAFDKVKAEKPDLVLLDLIMPKKSGFDVLKELKAIPELAEIPVMVLSNLSQATDAAETKKLGAIDFIVKAEISLQDLVNRIDKLFKS